MSERVAPPRAAASLILLRAERSGAVRILTGRRPRDARFMPGVWVFPGGAYEPERDDDAGATLAPTCHARLAHEAASSEDMSVSAEGLAACALRETEEETGLTLDRAAARPLFVARAVAPKGRKVRFDARFFAADAADAVVGDMDAFHAADGELEALSWRTLDEMAADRVAFPTRLVLAELAARASQGGVAAALDPSVPPLYFRPAALGATLGRIVVTPDRA